MNDWEGTSSVGAIRARFEGYVERFCRLASGQVRLIQANFRDEVQPLGPLHLRFPPEHIAIDPIDPVRIDA